jgi:putative transposase
MAEHVRADLVVLALEMSAVSRRKPAGGLVHHSDQGWQYISLETHEAAGEGAAM